MRHLLGQMKGEAMIFGSLVIRDLLLVTRDGNNPNYQSLITSNYNVNSSKTDAPDG